MSKNYLTEAFNQLEELDSELFSFNSEGAAELKSFIDDNTDDELPVNIVDPDATTEDELLDSYVGKIILGCDVCHSMIYKDADEIKVDEETQMVNVGEECPYCYSPDGFKVVGQVAEYTQTEAPQEDTDNLTEAMNKVRIPSPWNKYLQVSDYIPDVESGEYAIGEIVDGCKLVAYLDPKSQYEDVVDGWIMLFRDSGGKLIVGQPSHDCVYLLDIEDFKPLTEAMNKVSVETENSVTEVTSEGDKVTVTSEPKEQVSEEVIAPVDLEVQREIENNNEEPVEDETVDIDFDEFDEEDFDELGEGYLKKVYENVKSFKTTKGTIVGNKMKLEGLIEFASGKKATTTFIFESHSTTKRGKLKFIGENAQLSKNKKAFTLQGKVSGNKLMLENLTYNYNAKDSNNKSNHIYGRITRK